MMKLTTLEPRTRYYCDVCGREITNGMTTSGDLVFCQKTKVKYTRFMGWGAKYAATNGRVQFSLSCEQVFEIQQQIEEIKKGNE